MFKQILVSALVTLVVVAITNRFAIPLITPSPKLPPAPAGVKDAAAA